MPEFPYILLKCLKMPNEFAPPPDYSIETQLTARERGEYDKIQVADKLRQTLKHLKDGK